jgi:hypothetical protein
MRPRSDRSVRGTFAAALLLAITILPACSKREAASGTATAEATPAPVSTDEWRIEWVGSSTPETMPRGAMQEVRVTFRNAGDRGISADNLSASYHWYTKGPGGAPQLRLWDGIRTAIASVVAPGSEATVTLRVQTPDQPGDYLLVFDLVREGVSWFQFKGATPRVVPIKIL